VLKPKSKQIFYVAEGAISCRDISWAVHKLLRDFCTSRSRLGVD
jgi:hypothetical protein